MSAKTKRALRKKRYLDKKDVSQLYMKEYRESNRNAIRESQNKYYEQNTDVMKFGVRKHYEQNKDAKKLSVQQHYEQNKDAKNRVYDNSIMKRIKMLKIECMTAL